MDPNNKVEEIVEETQLKESNTVIQNNSPQPSKKKSPQPMINNSPQPIPNKKPSPQPISTKSESVKEVKKETQKIETGINESFTTNKSTNYYSEFKSIPSYKSTPKSIPKPVEPPKQPETPKVCSNTVSRNNDDWGTITPIKRKSTSRIVNKLNNSPQFNNDNKSVILSQEGIELLINTIVTELSNNFVTKEEVQQLVESSLQKMVMTGVNKRGK